jgi:hypothetical protein
MEHLRRCMKIKFCFRSQFPTLKFRGTFSWPGCVVRRPVRLLRGAQAHALVAWCAGPYACCVLRRLVCLLRAAQARVLVEGGICGTRNILCSSTSPK